MNRILLFLFMILTLSNISHAAFPVVTNTDIEVLDEINIKDSSASNDTPLFGILSVICSIIALLVLPVEKLYLFFIFSISALLFGIIGIRRRLKFLARIGIFIAFFEIIIVSLILFWVVVLGSGRLI